MGEGKRGRGRGVPIEEGGKGRGVPRKRGRGVGLRALWEEGVFVSASPKKGSMLRMDERGRAEGVSCHEP